MTKILCQFNKISGPNVIGDYTISFVVPKEHAEMLFESMLSLEKKSPVVIQVNKIESVKEGQQILDESEADRRIRFMKKVHADIDKLAIKYNLPSDDTKKRIKHKLKIESIGALSNEELLKLIDELEKLLIT